jgi:hypothetical protein
MEQVEDEGKGDSEKNESMQVRTLLIDYRSKSGRSGQNSKTRIQEEGLKFFAKSFSTRI